MLKKITFRHKEVMRRLLVAETPKEIARELGLHPNTISGWLHDPLFSSTLLDLEYATKTKILTEDGKAEALDIIKETMKDAALLCRETTNDTSVDLGLRMKSAWDILDRGGLKPTDKKIVAVADLSELIIEARRQREAAKEEAIPISAEVVNAK